ncbi:MAG TPA: nucleotidyltransferase family protein [Pyrinomonadaceae bacterium]|nr:nucleotidyltransferase family protein [Pyrinomonadaceae bacterium]
MSRLEDTLLLLCARTQVDAETRQRIHAISGSPDKLDWDYIYQMARRHSVLPLVYTQLSSAAENVPADQLARFRKNYQDNAARNLWLTAELCRILRSLAAAGIEAVPYKGPALAVYAYGNPALRRFVDLDILVRKADALRAIELLTAEGFVCGAPWTDAQAALLLRTQHNLSLHRHEGRLIVELHWELASNLFASSLQTEDLWERLQTMHLDNAAVKCLSSEDLLLSLCVHGSKHHWERLAWICDIAELVKRHADINWNLVLERASAEGNERMLFLGLYLAASLLDAPLPEQVKAKLEAAKIVAHLADDISQRLFAIDGQTPLTIRQSFRFNWQLRNGWRSRAMYCRHVLQPSDADVKTLRLPKPLSFGYYLIRPFGLLRRDRERRVSKVDAPDRPC